MSGGGGGKGGAKEVTVGYRYYMGVHLAVCHGPVDRVNRIIIGERLAWSGAASDNTTIYVNAPELFGGDTREGGVVGNVDVMMGGPSQGRNSYLTAFQGGSSPAYRGIMSLVFRSFLWASGNPYFKAPWVDLTRILEGWRGGSCWNPENATVNDIDMNPAHIIYQCLTDAAWGMGYNPSDIGDSFYTAATQLKNEGFGISILWDQQSTIEDFVQTILTHINGTLDLNLSTGKFELKLIRYDYNPATLLELNESNVIELKSFQRSAFGDSANEVVVTYTDREQNEKTVAVQDIASIAAQGGVISITKSYPGIRDANLAARVALRDLATVSSPLAQITVVTNRVMWDKGIGDVVRLNWPSLGIGGVAFRVIKIDKGTLTDGQIEATLVEDIFGLPEANYTSAPTSGWVDTVVPPVAADAARPVEAPYWEVVRNVSLANQQNLQPGYGFGQFMAGRGAVQSLLGYALSGSPNNIDYTEVSSGNFSPYGALVSNITATQETITLTGAFDLNAVALEDDGGYAYIDDECVTPVSVDPSTGVVVIKRGILDTVPKTHAAGTKMFFMTSAAAYDPTERTTGEVVYYKPRPSSGLGMLDLDDAEEEMLVFNNRASRPYPPGNFKVDGQTYPLTIPGPNVEVTWSHRDRAAQTVSFADYKTGNIGPEPGTTYRVRVYSGATLLHTYDLDGATTSWSYPTDHDDSDGNLSVLRITVNSVRDGLESLQAVDHTFQRNVTVGGYVIDSPPAAPILTASPDNFANYLSWNFGDLRTNLDYIELRVAEVPELGKSTVLQYVNYPDQDFLHELGSVRAFRWYWARAADVNGQLSPWSNMVSARANATDPVTMLNDINGLLTDGSGTANIQMIADRFSIVAPDGSKIPFAVVESNPGVWKTLLNSDVLIGGNVDIANLNTGALPSDVMMSLGGGVIELDGDGEIRVFKDLSANADFVRLSSGEIRFMRYISGVYQTYNYLSRLETGQANSGTVVTIPGYWKAQPRVMVSPASLALYKASYAAQDQALNCEALNIEEVVPGSGVWRFTPTATLTLAANSGGGAINSGSGDTSSNTYTSATQTTPANCVQITPTLQVRSQRGNGSSQYYRRTIKWRVEYWNGSSWVLGSWRNANMGDQFAAITDSQVFNFPGAGTWQWRISYEAFDTDGSVFGAVSYNYSQTTSTLTASTYSDSVSTGGSWPSYTPAEKNGYVPFTAAGGSGEIYQIDYSVTIEYVDGSSYSYDPSGNIRANVYAAIDGLKPGGARATYSNDYTVPGYSFTDYMLTNPNYFDGTDRVATKTVSGSSLPSTLQDFTYWLRAAPSSDGGSVVVVFKAGSAVVKRRTPATNSTTPSNNFLLSSYTYSLTSALILASGTLNWQAIGE